MRGQESARDLAVTRGEVAKGALGAGAFPAIASIALLLLRRCRVGRSERRAEARSGASRLVGRVRRPAADPQHLEDT